MCNNFKNNTRLFSVIIAFFFMASCQEDQPSSIQKIISKTLGNNSEVSAVVKKILETDSLVLLKNKKSVIAYYNSTNYETVWSNNKAINNRADSLVHFISNKSEYYGLFPKDYHQSAIDRMQKKISTIESIATFEIYLTDAFFQLLKHVKIGRLYTDTNYKYFDSNLHYTTFLPTLSGFLNDTAMDILLQRLEPNLHDYDSLKIALKYAIGNKDKKYTYVVFPFKDSAKFINSLLKRLEEESISNINKDSISVSNALKQWQKMHGRNETGKYDEDLIDALNSNCENKILYAALSMDKLKNIKIPNNGNYVLVNIPSYLLRAYTGDSVYLESKVAVGKVASKTPIMESEISEIILMPHWYVPPSILKIPGYIERKKRNPNYIVRGNRVMQKSGPGNALGEMKFNFKSGDAIYLHDTNEKWAFGSKKRAVSHGCVRVQQYKLLANFINLISPVVERRYKKVVDTYKVDSLNKDTIYKYKYVISDSVNYKGDSTIIRLLASKGHRELTVKNKVPIYIKYFTCAARNGNLIMYPDVYGYDKALIEKYFSL